MEEKKQNKVNTKNSKKQNNVKVNNAKVSNTKVVNKPKKNINKQIDVEKNKVETIKHQEKEVEKVVVETKNENILSKVTENENTQVNSNEIMQKTDNEQNQEKVTINVTVPKDKTLINNLITLFISFILFNIKWIKYKFEFFGYVSSASITILHSDMFDFSFLLGMSKIFAIISILLFFITIINTFIKLDEHIPSLKSFNLDKNLIVFYYGSYAISLILALIGVLFTKYSYLTIGYALTLIGYVICAYLTFKKEILRETQKIKEDISC